jgi:tripartite-type tricarboxylate transporter receptor subunit TctC
MPLRHRPLSSLLLALSAVFVAATVQAQDFPAKAVKVAVGSAAGGPVDTAARLISERLSEVWKQPVTVENRVGASEMIATDFVLKSPPDGYTLLVASLNVFTNNPVVFSKVPYDADRGWVPVAHLALNPMVLVAGQKAPFGTLKELIEQAKKAPGKVTYSTPGLATTNHIAGEWFASAAGVQLFHVPYKGGPAAANAVLSGDVPLAVVSLIQALPFVKSGQFKALGITTKDRTPLAPELPTVVEQGVPGFDAAVRVAMFAPAGTPAAIVNKINGDVTRALANPQTREKFAGMGVEASGSTPAELERMVRDVRAQIQRVVDTAKIKVEQ